MAKLTAAQTDTKKARTAARKFANKVANLERAATNRDRVIDAGIPPRESLHERTRTYKDGQTKTYTVVKQVRASKLLRSHRRSANKVIAARAAAHIAAASK